MEDSNFSCTLGAVGWARCLEHQSARGLRGPRSKNQTSPNTCCRIFGLGVSCDFFKLFLEHEPLGHRALKWLEDLKGMHQGTTRWSATPPKTSRRRGSSGNRGQWPWSILEPQPVENFEWKHLQYINTVYYIYILYDMYEWYDIWYLMYDI